MKTPHIILFILTIVFFTQCKDDDIYPDHLIAGDISIEKLYYMKFDADTIVPFITRYDTMKFEIDFNNNGLADIVIETFQEYSGVHSAYRASIVTYNNFFVALHDSVNSPLVLNKGDKIDNYLRWSTGRYNFVYHYGASGGISNSSGLWFQTDRNYAGIKYDNGGVIRYGWICMNFVYKEIRIYDYAIME